MTETTEGRRVTLTVAPLPDTSFELIAEIIPRHCLTAEEKAAMTAALETCIGMRPERATTRPLIIARARQALPPDVRIDWKGPEE